MELETIIRSIRKVHMTLTGADDEVNLTYTGGSAGQNNWKIKIGNRESKADKHIDAAQLLLTILTEELHKKASLAESQLLAYQKTLNEITKN